ncbi:hypothetical protein [Rosistilla oblonga]
MIGDRDGLASARRSNDVCHPIADAILAAADLPDDFEDGGVSSPSRLNR